MKTHIIQLERHDDAISTRDKMLWARSQRILLVFPERGAILSRRVDLVILQRHSQSLGAQLALVTRSTAVRQHAGDLGIPVFRSVMQAQKSPWRVPLEVRRKTRRISIPRLPLDDLRQKMHRPPRNLNLGARLLFFSTGIAAVLALAAFLFPSAEIRLPVTEQEQRLSMEIWASPAVAEPNISGGVPVSPVEVVVTGVETGSTTGRTILADQAAAGTVTIVSLTDRELLIPAGTIVRTLGDAPVRFETTISVVVKPGEDGANIPVRAVQSGSAGNVPAGEIIAIEGSVGASVAVHNDRPTSGGTDRSSLAPNREDFEQARARLLESLKAQAEQEMIANLSDDTYLLAPSIELVQVTAEERQPLEGQPGEQLRLEMTAVYTAWTVSAVDIRAAARMAMDANLPAGYAQLRDRLSFTLVGEPRVRGSSIGYAVDATRTIRARWSKEEVIHEVLGRDLYEAVYALRARYGSQGTVLVSMSPAWWPRMPYLPFRIQVGDQ